MVEFFSDTLRFLLFGTDEKPFPFKNEDEEFPDNKANDVDDVVEVEEAEVEEVVSVDDESDTTEIKD